MRTNIVLGDRVKCRLTGFEGIVTARTEWLYGCVRWGVQSEKLSDKGLTMEPLWFDDDQLTVTKNNAALTPGLEEAASEPRRTGLPAPGGPDRGESADDPAETG